MKSYKFNAIGEAESASYPIVCYERRRGCLHHRYVKRELGVGYGSSSGYGHSDLRDVRGGDASAGYYLPPLDTAFRLNTGRYGV